MTVHLNPYLGFVDNAREAMEFYQSVFGGNLDLTTFGEFGLGGPDDAAKVMHSQLTTPNGLIIQASDAPEGQPTPAESSISLSLFGDAADSDELHDYWNKLSADGNVLEQLVAAPWGDTFGMVVDRYSVLWMINIAGAQAAE